jgi:hypothetical protein
MGISRDISKSKHASRMKKRIKIYRFGLAAALCTLAVLAYSHYVYRFLSPAAAIDAPVVIIEGWIPDSEIEQAARHIVERNYKTIIITGGPLDYGFFLTEYRTFAEAGRATIGKLTNRDDVIAVSAPPMRKDRTYASALALKAWFNANGITERRFNLISSDVHTRRSWRIFQLTLGNEYTVGALAIPPQSYNPDKWWAYSEGFKTVMSESLAYLYTVCIFPFTDEWLNHHSR